MKRYLLLLIFPAVFYAQVGIGTTNPTADLHVAGNTSTIRIESLNAVNSPVYNNGVKPSFAYVTNMGDVTINPSITNGTEPGGGIAPLNFLVSIPNFIPNGPNNFGTIINNSTAVTNMSGFITKVDFSSPITALVEVKYVISALTSFTDLNVAATPFNDISSRIFKIYFCIDIDNDGLSAAELSKIYGLNAQSYASYNQGILGYSFTNGHGYSTIPAGNHSIHFFAQIVDGPNKLTSIGFGGAEDYVKIRVYN